MTVDAMSQRKRVELSIDPPDSLWGTESAEDFRMVRVLSWDFRRYAVCVVSLVAWEDRRFQAFTIRSLRQNIAAIDPRSDPLLEKVS